MELGKLTVQTEFLDGIKQPIYIKNDKNIYVYCNSAFSKLVGIPVNKIIGATIEDILPNSKISKALQKTDNILKSEVEQDKKLNIEPESPPSATTEISLEKTVVYGPNHELAGIIGTANINSEVTQSGPVEIETLSKRERAILDRMVKGESVKQIANSLNISTHTVADHKKSIFLKLGVHTTGEAVFKAIAYLTSTKLTSITKDVTQKK